MPGEHAKLSPSSAERWIQCPGSIRLTEELGPAAGDGDSAYAREGTAAHALAEIRASLAFGMITKRESTSKLRKWRSEFGIELDTEREMWEHTTAYLDLLVDRIKLYPNSVLLLEQRMPTGLPDGGKGTSDAVIVSPEHVEIIDLKYGKGVEVIAEGNPQLRIYGKGALDTFGDILGETKVVRSTVHQPRLNHVLTEELTPAELHAWHASIFPIAEEALGPDAHFGPSEKACRWCPASGRCRAQLEAVFAQDFEVDPALLTPEEMAEVLDRVPLIRVFLNAFEEAALTAAYSRGETIPGWKVVLSGGKRTVVDPEGAIQALLDDGYTREEVVAEKVRGIGELEKLLGKKRFEELVSPFVQKGTGKPALVPEDDDRPAIEPNTEATKVDWDE